MTRYGALEGSVRGMVALVRSERHESVADEQLDAVEKKKCMILFFF